MNKRTYPFHDDSVFEISALRTLKFIGEENVPARFEFYRVLCHYTLRHVNLVKTTDDFWGIQSPMKEIILPFCWYEV